MAAVPPAAGAAGAAHLTFEQLLVTSPDPYVANPDALLTAFEANNPPSPETCEGRALNASHCQLYLIADSVTNRPIVAIAPFRYQSLPGVAAPHANQSFAFWGDVDAQMPIPTIIRFERTRFHLVNNVRVPTIANMAAEWTARGHQNYLGSYDAAAAGTEEVRSRRIIPLPHAVAAQALVAQTRGELTWEWAWMHFCQHAVGDAVLSVRHEQLLNFVRVASVMRPGATAADPDQIPETALATTPVALTADLQRQVTTQLRSHLVGHVPATGAGQQLLHIVQQQQQQNQALQQQANRRKTIMDKNPTAGALVVLLSGVADHTHLTPFWQAYGDLKSSSWLVTLEGRVEEVATHRGWATPLLNASLVTDIGNGRLISPGLDKITEGLSIFRIRTQFSSDYDARVQQNRTYEVLTSGVGAPSMDAAQLILQNDDVEYVGDSQTFQSYVEGFGVLLEVLFGPTAPFVARYREDLVPQLRALCGTIKQTIEVTQEPTIYLLIMVTIWRYTNAYWRSLTNPLNVPANVPLPDYAKIIEAAGTGTLVFLTTLPKSLVSSSGGPPSPTSVIPPVAPPPTGGNRGQGGAEPELQPHQNPRLRTAWTKLNAGSIYRKPGDRFYDAKATDNRNRKKVVGDDGSQICLPMALTGRCYKNCRNGKHTPLSPSEEEKVAKAASPPFQL